MALGMEKQSAVRDSDVRKLLQKVQRRKYESYLVSMKLVRLRAYRDTTIHFDFPVTALVGPNGGGKTTILGAAAITSSAIKPKVFFAKSGTYDKSMVDWRIESEAIDKHKVRKLIASYPNKKWDRSTSDRTLRTFGVARTLPATERKDLTKFIGGAFTASAEQPLNKATVQEVETILGKEAASYLLVSADKGAKQQIYAAATPDNEHYSEFHFGAGEASVIRIVNDIENAPNNSLILIEEIENGLHPVAVRRLVEYLVRVAAQKNCQVIFTTHSNDALAPLPDEAVWACGNGMVTQGKLDVESLRALTGSVEASLTIFVEDDFASLMVVEALRDFSRRHEMSLLGIDIHYVGGHSNAVKFTTSQNANPAIRIPAVGILDGDQAAQKDESEHIYCLPGTEDPESHVYETVADNIDSVASQLAIRLGLTSADQTRVSQEVTRILRANRDPHLLFRELGDELEFTSEAIVKNAFLTTWTTLRGDEVDAICLPIADLVKPELVEAD